MMRLFLALLFLSSVFLDSAAGDDGEGELFQCKKRLSPAEERGLIPKIQDHYRGVLSMKARFVQRSFFAGLEREEESRGTLSFKKPGMMDWHYETPEEQRFISDGRNFYYYQPELQQVIVSDFTNSFDSNLPVSFLLGVGDLEQSFKLLQACHGDGGHILAEFEPRGKEGEVTLKKFTLLVAGGHLAVKGARMNDVAGNVNTILLILPELNVPIPAEEFAFQIPRGMDVIDKRGVVQGGGGRKQKAPLVEERIEINGKRG